ncbi:stage II sporulation protein P [Paenibacillus ginsengarvi]|nr:stage II sporulation protein P [Paenibacillus ginsengarvi]
MNVREWREVWYKAVRSVRGQDGMMGRIFAAYAGIALLMIALAAAAAMWQAHSNVSPKAAMKRMAASVSPQFFIDMLGLESQAMKRGGESTFSSGRVGTFVADTLLHIKPGEPRTLLASELPQMRGNRLLAAPGGNRTTGGEEAGKGANGAAVGSAGAGDAGSVPTAQEPAVTPVVAETKPELPQGGNVGEAQASPAGTKPSTDGRKVVFVYHSHPRESWVSELNVKNANEAEDSQKNVTLVGKRLADKLEENGIGSMHSGVDYPTKVTGYNWNYSYKYSLQTVKDAVAQNKDITFLFDIHRDSAARDITTASIGGTDYAKVYFIVGKKNERWEQNESFARRIHEKLESAYPGLSRGIWDKGSGGHAEYNQSVSPNSILVEIGGPFNTLEECYRTADALAGVIAGLYWDAEKVNASAKVAAKGTTVVAGSN